jgi:hypothetical protein
MKTFQTRDLTVVAHAIAPVPNESASHGKPSCKTVRLSTGYKIPMRDSESELLREAYREAVDGIIARAAPGVHPHFRPANVNKRSILHSLALPASIELFYEEFAPDDKLGVWGIERDCVLLPIAGIEWYKNTEKLGTCLTCHGYVIFATTCSGDVYCFDLSASIDNRGEPILLFSHERDYSDLSRTEIAPLGNFVSESVLGFLASF